MTNANQHLNNKQLARGPEVIIQLHESDTQVHMAFNLPYDKC
jgi:hypothetical protein